MYQLGLERAKVKPYGVGCEVSAALIAGRGEGAVESEPELELEEDDDEELLDLDELESDEEELELELELEDDEDEDDDEEAEDEEADRCLFAILGTLCRVESALSTTDRLSTVSGSGAVASLTTFSRVA